jgi:transposase-like protein
MGAFAPRYSEERKAAVLNKLLPPQNRSVVSVSAEEGISYVTLYSWLKQYRQQGMPAPGNRNTGEDWSLEAKLAVVVETASMSEAELSAYCREKGLYPEQVQRRKEACLQGVGMQEDQDKAAQKQNRESRKTIKKLKAEVRRKDKALAEITSLLVLSKKLEALYGEDPDSSEDD